MAKYQVARDRTTSNDPDFHEFVSGLHALIRLAESDKVAQAALILISDESSLVTGSEFLADGGFSINNSLQFFNER